MEPSDLITALTGGTTYRERSGLPEAKDFATRLSDSKSPDQYTLMKILLEPIKDELIAKAIADRALLSKQA
jgi:hypothetical protein